MGGGRPNRAVSDVLAFSLTFAIIITGVGLVSVVALEPITTFSDNQEVVNGERGLQAAGSTIDDIHRSGDPYERFDLVPGDGTLFVNETTLTLEGDELGAALGGSGDSFTLQANALEHRFEDRSLGLEAGAVFRTDALGLSYGPSIRCDDGRATVSLVKLTTTDTIRTSGTFDRDVAIGPTRAPAGTPIAATNGFAAFEAEYGGVEQTSVDGNVSIDVSGSAAPENWNQHLADAGWTDDGNWWVCDTDRAFVRIVTVELTQLE
jgi:FlaG/FlaF family flagellin (archaellin)